jgi:hypothetical protein
MRQCDFFKIDTSLSMLPHCITACTTSGTLPDSPLHNPEPSRSLFKT